MYFTEKAAAELCNTRADAESLEKNRRKKPRETEREREETDERRKKQVAQMTECENEM